MRISDLINKCREAGEQWAIDVRNETADAEAVRWGAGDVGDLALVTAEGTVSHEVWSTLTSEDRSTLIDAVLAGARAKWTGPPRRTS
jgi:hypothetical protein